MKEKDHLGYIALNGQLIQIKVVKEYEEGRDCVKRCQDAFYWSLLETNVWFPQKAASFLSSYAKISFSVRNFSNELVVYVSRGHNECKSDV